MLVIILFLLFLFNINCIIYSDHSLEAPFKFQREKYNGVRRANYIASNKYIDQLTGKQEYEDAQCIAPSGRYVGNGAISQIPAGTTFYDYDFMWKCTESRENANRMSLEPISCSFFEKDAKEPKEVKPGDSKMAENGYVKYFCDNWNGGMKRVTEYGCIVRKSITGDFRIVDGNETYITSVKNYDQPYSLTEVEVEWVETIKGQRYWRCEETEPGLVTFRKVTKEELGCTFKNQFHKFGKHWDDYEMGARLICTYGNKIEKIQCLVNGKEYGTTYGKEFQLTNGCTFICHWQKNIFKCPDQMTFLEVMKTATTKVPVTVKSELGF